MDLLNTGNKDRKSQIFKFKHCNENDCNLIHRYWVIHKNWYVLAKNMLLVTEKLYESPFSPLKLFVIKRCLKVVTIYKVCACGSGFPCRKSQQSCKIHKP